MTTVKKTNNPSNPHINGVIAHPSRYLTSIVYNSLDLEGGIMARTLEQILEQEKPEVVLQANEKAAEILKDIDEMAETSAAGDKSGG